MSQIEKKVADFIGQNQMLSTSSRVLLAVSGGADSTALMHIMRTLQIEKILNTQLHCAHINHSLRASQAKEDENFITTEVEKLGLPLTIRQIDVRKFAAEQKLSIETAARKLRIDALIDIAEKNGCDTIATGHQKNDNAETVIYRLLRGTGFRGLAGIWPVREFDNKIKFVRPLLCADRNEICEYLQKNGLRWTEDATNADCFYARNFIRHLLLPAMQNDSKDSLVEQLCLLSKSALGFHNIVCRQADQVWLRLAVQTGGEIVLNSKLLAELPEPVRIELISRSLDAINCGQMNITQIHYKNILRLTEQNTTGRKIGLPGGFVVKSEYGNLIFSKATAIPPVFEQTSEGIEIKIPGSTQFGQYLIDAKVLEKRESNWLTTRFIAVSSSNFLAPSFTGGSVVQFIEQFDLDKLRFPLTTRCRRDGDRFVPFGQKDEKKIGKFLTAQKVPDEIRQKTLVVTDSEKIIWLWPIRISEQVKITAVTSKILQLQITDGT